MCIEILAGQVTTTAWDYRHKIDSSCHYAYQYDDIGNRQSAVEPNGAFTYAANALNQYTQLNRTIEQSEQSNNFSYDADGNLTNDGRNAYVYDGENRLVSVTPLNPQSGTRAIESAYDHRSRRIRKVVKLFDGAVWQVAETHTFVWDGWNIVFEQIAFAGNTSSLVEYFWGNDISGTEQGAGGIGGLLATRIDGVLYFPVYDGNGNIMMYVNAAGEVVAQYDYDPYGNILQATGSLASQFAFGFSTKYHDREVGLVAYQLRVYNPVHGRWLNRDPIGEAGGENLYGFCRNSAIGCYDLLGMDFVSLFRIPQTGVNMPTVVSCFAKPEWNLRKTPQRFTKMAIDISILRMHLYSQCHSKDKMTVWRKCCRANECKSQADAVVEEILNSVTYENRMVLTGGWRGNIVTFFSGGLFGNGCVEWQRIVLEAVERALSKYPSKCFKAIGMYNEYFDGWTHHNWVTILGPDDKIVISGPNASGIQVDPWPSGGMGVLPDSRYLDGHIDLD